MTEVFFVAMVGLAFTAFVIHTLTRAKVQPERLPVRNERQKQSRPD